jgi:arylsulfatase A
MIRTQVWFLALFAAVAFLCLSSCAVAAERPNFLVIMTDDQGWSDLGVHGNPILKTPNLDRLCQESVEFTRFYVSPVCSLTRASLLTGRHPLRTGCYDTRFGHDTLDASEITIADILKTANYRTAIFGKWHLGRYMRYHPNHRGFDEFFGFWQYGHVERYFYPDRLWHNKERVECRGHITELFTDSAIDFITSANQPFFCYVAYNVPHAPFLAPQEFVETYAAQNISQQDARIYALIEHCDSQIGRLLETIDHQGIRENTVVLFLSDNGGISRHFSARLRGSKGAVYENGIRSPFFARYPERFPAGKKVPVMGDVIDVFPTITELAGVSPPGDRPIDGVSLVPWLQQPEKAKQPHSHLYHMWSRDLPQNNQNWAVHDSRYKLVNGELYDLSQDEGETRDLAGDHPKLVAKLRREYERWFDEVTADRNYDRVPIEVGRADENPVELQMSWGQLHGETKYTFDAYDWDVVDGWRMPGDAVEWSISVVQPGRYEVSVSYGSDLAESGGLFRVRVGASEIEGRVEPTPTADVFVTRRVGVLQLEAGDATVRVEAASVPGQELMKLNRVWLKRLD